MKKSKTYIVVRLKSSQSKYSKYMKMSRKCMDAINNSKASGLNKYDPVIRQHCLFTLVRAK